MLSNKSVQLQVMKHNLTSYRQKL